MFVCIFMDVCYIFTSVCMCTEFSRKYFCMCIYILVSLCRMCISRYVCVCIYLSVYMCAYILAYQKDKFGKIAHLHKFLV